MSKFVFYIINREDGMVTGTNDFDVCEALIEDENYILIHQAGTYFCGDREGHEVEDNGDAAGLEPETDEVDWG